LKEWGVRLWNASASGIGENSSRAKDYSIQSGESELLHLHDAQSGWILADERDFRTHESDDFRRQTIEYKRVNALEIGETIAHVAAHT
jgi:hypothetical protein